jgi:hypothetical protein
MVLSNQMRCRAIKKDGNRCKYSCGDNFMCGIHTHKAESLQCSICHEDMICSQSITTDCNHTFHTECYEEWRNQRFGNSCPLCREKIPKLDSQEIDSLKITLHEHSIKYTKDLEELAHALYEYSKKNYKDIKEFSDVLDYVNNMKNLLIKNNFSMIELINDKLRKNPCKNDRILLNSFNDFLYKRNNLIIKTQLLV